LFTDSIPNRKVKSPKLFWFFNVSALGKWNFFLCLLVHFLLPNTQLVYHSFEASRKITRHQQSLTWLVLWCHAHLTACGQGSNQRPSDSEPSTLPQDHSFRWFLWLLWFQNISIWPNKLFRIYKRLIHRSMRKNKVRYISLRE